MERVPSTREPSLQLPHDRVTRKPRRRSQALRGLSDFFRGLSVAAYDRESMRRSAQVELSEGKIPDEKTILRFRHLLEKHGLTEAISRIRARREHAFRVIKKLESDVTQAKALAQGEARPLEASAHFAHSLLGAACAALPQQAGAAAARTGVGSIG